ncbi:uncharacterized protein LOC133815979 [Humulus lupulus]|uniref:uncharacterized protein LOC133815979 n=1 Tax=Humulus lupulus TaxID=3486 RepID=UPI002B40F496|nr:uncharacterized protein LOC133815979 [Humulus lupulus]
MNIVLICENREFVFTKECLEVPATKAPKTAREKYDAWILSNNKAKFYMLASMGDVLRKKHEDMETAYEIWESLQAMFGQQFDQCRHEKFMEQPLMRTFESLNKSNSKVEEENVADF